MNLQVRIISLIVSVLFVAYVIQLVRSRKLRETDSIVWILAGVAIFILAVWVKPLILLTRLIGAKLWASTLFFSGLVFLTFVSLWITTRISALSDEVRELAQRVTLLSGEEGPGKTEATTGVNRESFRKERPTQ
ncbi:MAG TPA: DUF2304 domain-containing protein [bacterium]|nr:DUF2304 domain-containing protein [bacterium]